VHQPLPRYTRCLVCGSRDANIATLNTKFYADGDTVTATVRLGPETEGYKGIVHGGIVAGLLDECIGWAACVKYNRFHLTREIKVRYLRPIPVGSRVTVTGTASECKGRLTQAQGELCLEDGTLAATAEGTFFRLPKEKSLEVADYLTYDSGDLDFRED
jgi:uncharacterized protein (TIGR00369 family)